ncbi:MAG TPA: hypothetical protein VJ483_09175 [Holophagaceae bacterium]|nr:hypothetical protein [Holophagaceae bacterium]
MSALESELHPEAPRKRGAFQRLLESLTLLTLLAAVSFYLVGRVFVSAYLGAFGQVDLNATRSWEIDVFQGFGATLNTLAHIEDPAMRGWLWFALLTLLAGLGARWAYRKLQRPWLRWPLTLGLGYFAMVCYLGMLLRFGNGWGAETVRVLRSAARNRHHFIFQDSAKGAFPEALFADNDAGGLKVIQETPDYLLLLSADNERVYRVSTREIRLHEITLPKP